MGQEDVLPPQDREDQQETAGDHEKDEEDKGKAENQRKGRVDVSQPHHGDIPKEKDEKEEEDTGKD